MPETKQQLFRYQTLLTMMRKGKYVNHTSLSHELWLQDSAITISPKTFGRDIAYLMNDLHAPIKYDTSMKGYYLTNQEWYSEDLLVEPFDMKAALLGEQVARGIMPPAMSAEISKAIGALMQRNDSGMAEGVQLDTFQFLSPKFLPQVKPEIFLACYRAWEGRHYLKLTYCSSKGHVCEKLFEPHIFAWCGGIWYLKGLLHRDDDTHYDPYKNQVLALHRIQDIKEVAAETFPPIPELLKTIENKGLFAFEQFQEIIMVFDKPFDKVAEEIFQGANGTILERTDTTTKVSIKNIPMHQILQVFFYAWGHATVLSPERVRQKVRKIARKILENHPEA